MKILFSREDNMKVFKFKNQRKLLTVLSMMLFVIIGCTTLRTTITSEPPGADIYMGSSRDRLEPSNNKTPFTLSGTDIGAYWKPWYYQVKKEGYKDSEIIFKEKENGDRFVHFQLKPKTVTMPVNQQIILTPTPTITTNIPDNDDSILPQNKSRNLIKGIQLSLQGLGYTVENISGELDQNTVSVIKKFQNEHNLIIDGIPTIELLKFSFSLKKDGTISNIGCSQRKNCSELTSCEEALYYLNVCGDGRLDHNNSGIPCEESTCNYVNRIVMPLPTLPPTPTPTIQPLPPVNIDKPVDVRGYYRKDGTYVRPHTRKK